MASTSRQGAASWGAARTLARRLAAAAVITAVFVAPALGFVWGAWSVAGRTPGSEFVPAAALGLALPLIGAVCGAPAARSQLFGRVAVVGSAALGVVFVWASHFWLDPAQLAAPIAALLVAADLAALTAGSDTGL